MWPQILRGGPLAILQQPAWYCLILSKILYVPLESQSSDIPHHWYLVHCPCLKANAKLCPVLVVAAVATSQSRRSVKPLLCISCSPLSWILGSSWFCLCGLSYLSAATTDHCKELLRAALVNSIATDDRGWLKKIFEDFPKILKEVLSKPQRLWTTEAWMLEKRRSSSSWESLPHPWWIYSET